MIEHQTELRATRVQGQRQLRKAHVIYATLVLSSIAIASEGAVDVLRAGSHAGPIFHDQNVGAKNDG